MKFDRKAQITTFIIIGIILLMTSAFVFYIKNRLVERAEELEEIEIVEVPLELNPIKFFVEDCLSKTAKEAVERIGANGGYIGVGVEDVRYTGKTFDLDMTGLEPTEADALTFFPGSEYAVPYWYYLKSPNRCSGDCQFASNQPAWRGEAGEGNSVEKQIELYVDANLNRCLADFGVFQPQQIIVKPTDSPKTNVVITEDDVMVGLEYPLEITDAEGKISRMGQFVTRLPVDLEEIYSFASQFIDTLTTRKFLEMHTMEIISAYGGLQKELPPTNSFDFSYESESWRLSEVKDRLEDVLMDDIQVLQVVDTANFEYNYFPGDELRQGLYDNMIISIGESNLDLMFEMVYLKWWPIYLKIGTGGELIKPSAVFDFPAIFQLLPLREYQLPYDVSYPILVTIKNPDSFKGEGFSLMFAVEVNI
ncbi:hypothetical protein KY339_02780, partial [Candidatus Woesearchaeota archaeon]|nr:hypothetical protein [Candidatus Woesearchaeota archaeon]